MAETLYRLNLIVRLVVGMVGPCFHPLFAQRPKGLSTCAASAIDIIRSPYPARRPE